MPRPKPTHVDDAKTFGRRLREARIAAGLSQEALAAAGCSQSYIARIESGSRVPSPGLIHEFGRLTGVPPDVLASGETIGIAASRGPRRERSQLTSAVRSDSCDALDQYGGGPDAARSADGISHATAILLAAERSLERGSLEWIRIALPLADAYVASGDVAAALEVLRERVPRHRTAGRRSTIARTRSSQRA